MTKETISISNAYDGVALTQKTAAKFALFLECQVEEASGPGLIVDAPFLRMMSEIAAILRGKRRDGSEPAEDAP